MDEDRYPVVLADLPEGIEPSIIQGGLDQRTEQLVPFQSELSQALLQMLGSIRTLRVVVSETDEAIGVQGDYPGQSFIPSA